MSTATLPALGTMTKRVLRVYDRATDTERLAGTQWYLQAFSFVRAASRVHSDAPTENLAVALAHLSPRVHWSRNKRMLLDILETGDTVGLRGAIDRAKDALVSDNPLGTLNGPKTSAFARNILGDTQAVTVDVHAAYIALGEYPSIALKGKAYDDIASAYRNAAKLRGVEPSVMQAVTWCVHRGRAN